MAGRIGWGPDGEFYSDNLYHDEEEETFDPGGLLFDAPESDPFSVVLPINFIKAFDEDDFEQ